MYKKRKTYHSIVSCKHLQQLKIKHQSQKPCGHKGISHYRAKIDKETGLEIYNKYENNNIKKKVLANDYGVSVRTIDRIVTCNNWTTRDLLDE